MPDSAGLVQGQPDDIGETLEKMGLTAARKEFYTAEEKATVPHKDGRRTRETDRFHYNCRH